LTGAIDNRQHEPGWSQDGRSVLFTVMERGNSWLYRMPVDGGKPEAVVSDPGTVGSWSVYGNRVAYSFSSPEDGAELYLTWIMHSF